MIEVPEAWFERLKYHLDNFVNTDDNELKYNYLNILIGYISSVDMFLKEGKHEPR